jgi:hypothetical protein
MTEPVGNAVRGQLWPTRDRLVQYLDNWVGYVTELEEKIRVREEAYATSERVLTKRIEELRQEIGDTERPLLERVAALEAQRLTLDTENKSLRHEMDSATKLLAAAMEVGGTRHSLILLANDAVSLAEEAKKIVRENL